MKQSNIFKTIMSLSLSIGAFTLVGVSLNNKTMGRADATAHQDNYAAYTYKGSYYNNIDESSFGMNGALRTGLSSLITPKGYYVYGSSGSTHLSTILQYADEDPTNSSNMVYLYTRDSVKKNAASSWNREHVWPQANSNNCWGTTEAGVDILHIRPTYESTNNKRSNLKYGDAPSGTWLTYNNMKYGRIGGSYFEPLDATKGDVARIIMYVWVAYYDVYKTNLPDISKTFQSFDTLLKWHALDVPDKLEGNRNDYAQSSKQKNRNPFVDHPEYAWKIFGDKCSAETLDLLRSTYPAGEAYLSLDKTSLSMKTSEVMELKATTSDSSDISWSVSDSSVIQLGGTTSKSGETMDVVALSAGTATITVEATIDGKKLTKECQVTVSEGPYIRLSSVPSVATKGEIINITATSNVKGEISWSTSDGNILIPSVATSASGEEIMVIAMNVGKASITAEIEDGNRVLKAEKEITVKEKEHTPTPTPSPTHGDPTPTVPVTPTPSEPTIPSTPTPSEPTVPVTPTVEPTVTPTPQPEKSGCRGSLVSSSILISSLSLIGLALLILKKRR